MGILDTAFMLGRETDYGTPVSLTRAFENKKDDFKHEIEFIESVGFRAGLQTGRGDRFTGIPMGGGGSIEVDVLNIGMGMLFEALLGTLTGPTQVAATDAYTQIHDADSDGPDVSFTAQWLRARVGTDATQQFTNPGTKPTGWKISQSPKGLLVLTVDIDFQDEETQTAAGTPVYPTAAGTFNWSQCVVTLDSTPIDCLDFEFNADLTPDTDRHYLGGSALKKEPFRGDVPTYDGSLTVDFEDATRYAEFAAGANHDLAVMWSYADDAIESGHTFEFELVIPEFHWTGETPDSDLSEQGKQPLPFKVTHDGTNPAVTVNIKSTDTAL